MKPLFIALFSLAATFLARAADDNPQLPALQAADDKRVAAMKSGDRNALEAIFSDDLHYAHSNGIVDTKQSFIEILGTGKTKYHALDSQERAFTFPAPGIALMKGRVRIQVTNATGKVDSVLSYLAVWREEKGQWRFLAWQSCRLPAPEAKP